MPWVNLDMVKLSVAVPKRRSTQLFYISALLLGIILVAHQTYARAFSKSSAQLALFGASARDSVSAFDILENNPLIDQSQTTVVTSFVVITRTIDMTPVAATAQADTVCAATPARPEVIKYSFQKDVPLKFIDYASKTTQSDLSRLEVIEASGTQFRATAHKSLYGLSGDRTWLEHVESVPDEYQYPMTKFAQRTIHAHQNPANCTDKKFFRIKNASGLGLGAALHSMAEALGYAMYHDRILVTDLTSPPLSGFVERKDCRNGDPFECVWESISSCSAYVTDQNTIDIKSSSDLYPNSEFPKPALGVTAPILGYAMQKEYPGITTNALKVWSRSQSIAYVNRLRPAALRFIANNRLNQSLHSAFTGPRDEPKYVEFPFPLPPKVWSMHIRHGDKASEMTLQPTVNYVLAAEKFSMMNPISSRKWAFVSSEDPEVFEEIRDIVSLKKTNTVSNHEWHWFASNINRLNSGPFQQLKKFGNRTETTLSWLLEAFTAIECEGFVGTRSSNWNILIDELRGTWGIAGRAPYLEIGPEGEWNNYFW